MKRCNRTFFLLAVLSTVGTVHAADTLTGTWKMYVTYDGRSRLSILRLNSQADKLTGAMFHYQGSRSRIENGSYEDGELSFEVTRTRRGETYTTKYSGTFDQDTIRGKTRYWRRGEIRTVDWSAERTHDSPLSAEVVTPPVEANIDLNDSNYEIWRDHILPEASEMAWEEIPWLTTFKDGILAADAAQKPLLLWTMNGHPLGCT